MLIKEAHFIIFSKNCPWCIAHLRSMLWKSYFLMSRRFHIGYFHNKSTFYSLFTWFSWNKYYNQHIFRIAYLYNVWNRRYFIRHVRTIITFECDRQIASNLYYNDNRRCHWSPGVVQMHTTRVFYVLKIWHHTRTITHINIRVKS